MKRVLVYFFLLFLISLSTQHKAIAYSSDPEKFIDEIVEEAKIILNSKDSQETKAKKLSLKDGAATLTEFTADICSKKLVNGNVYVSGGGRKNNFLIRSIEKKISSNISLIDKKGIDGDYIESQAFAYLAIRSYLKLPISFPKTTGCKKPCTGGVLVKNF